MSRNPLPLPPLPEEPGEEIEHFTLDEMFGDGHTFALHLAFKTLMHLAASEQDAPLARSPHLVAQVQFTERELDLCQPLLHTHPGVVVPYEVLLASFERGYFALSERSVARARARLEAAKAIEGAWDEVLRPVRNVMSRTRFKLREVGLEVVSLLEIGYVLMKNPRW
jgi:hypothetical protein